jgi:glutamate--cysteine ligase
VTDVNADLLRRRRNEIHVAAFSPAADSRRVGAEVELLALDEETRMPLPLLRAKQCLVSLIREHGTKLGWREAVAYGPVPKFVVPERGIISFEPGGQLEFSANAERSASAVLRSLEAVILPLRAALREQGVRLESVGIDPLNDAREVPLQLPVERYETMTRYFDRRGPFGVRMMRQTASIQVSLDRGPLPTDRWWLLNDLAPYVIAIFANSPTYLGHDSGYRSFRAHCWRSLDATRTGVALPHDDASMAYARFALEANDMLRSLEMDTPFWTGDRAHDDEAWQIHLTTLFPEVRPRGHFEVRSCDAIDPMYYAAPLIFLSGLAYDAAASKEAAVLAGESRALLRAAGQHALRDQSIARTARDLAQLALAGAARLGEDFCNARDLEVARAFFEAFTSHDRSPADDHAVGDRTAGSSTPALTT